MHLNICGTTASGNLVAVLPRPPPSDQFHTPSTRNPINATTYHLSPLLIGATIAVAGKDCPLLSLRQWHRHGGQSTEAPTRCFKLTFRFNSPVLILQGVFCYGTIQTYRFQATHPW